MLMYCGDTHIVTLLPPSSSQQDSATTQSLSNPSFSLTPFHSLLQKKDRFTSQKINARFLSTSHTCQFCQITNGRAGRPREVFIKMATCPVWGHWKLASKRRHTKKNRSAALPAKIVGEETCDRHVPGARWVAHLAIHCHGLRCSPRNRTVHFQPSCHIVPNPEAKLDWVNSRLQTKKRTVQAQERENKNVFYWECHCNNLTVSHVRPSMLTTKFHTHTTQQAKL